MVEKIYMLIRIKYMVTWSIESILFEYMDSTISRYKSALYTFQLYKNLRETRDSTIHMEKDTNNNGRMRNNFEWILWDNIEKLYLQHSIIILYGVYEHKEVDNTWFIEEWDTISIYLLLQFLQKNTTAINALSDRLYQSHWWEKSEKALDERCIDEIIGKISEKRDFIDTRLRNFRHCICHNFPGKKKAKKNKLATIKITELEELLESTWAILNEITSLIYSRPEGFEGFSERIADDYRRLFHFLNKQESVCGIMMNSWLEDSEKLNQIKTLYHLNY